MTSSGTNFILAAMPASWQVQVESFGHSYAEVLAFLKHTDDKIGRLLTALAFLTASGVALFTFSRGAKLPAGLEFGSSNAPVGTIFFLLFMGSVVAALAIAFIALDPTSQRPGFAKTARDPSPLFYESIYEEPGWWDSLLNSATIPGDNALKKVFARAYHADAAVLSRRARHKVRRLGDCQAFFQLSIVMLILLAIVRTGFLAVRTREILVLVTLGVVPLVPAVTVFEMNLLAFPGVRDAAPRSWFERTKLAVVYLVPPALIVGTLFTSAFSDRHWWGVSYALAWIVVSRLAIPRRRVAVPAAGVATLAGFLLLVWTLSQIFS